MELDFPKLERKILKFWRENRTFEKSIQQRAKARDFIFYEGPPTANAKAGLHHVLARIYKDIICRYKTMQGFRVLRKAGWDTHGLPVELEIEKKLGLKSKKDIEKYGIAKFNKKCKESVWEYKKDWENLTERIAFWLDMEHPYITYENDYIETLWRIIKQIYQKGLLYKDYKVVPYCSRCGTSLSSHEVALGYKKIKEPSIYIKLKVKSEKRKAIYLLVWTTTPWTLPGNVAIAVGPNFTYVKAKVGEEYLILAKERLSVLEKEYKIIEEFKGKDLLSLKYEPLYREVRPPREVEPPNIYKVIGADFVSLEEGTGLVHMAPAFGEEDMIAGKKNNLPIILNVDEGGKFKKEVKNWAGKWVKDADPLIIEDLKKRNLLFKEELYEHDYPFCWRCDSPLLYYAKESWFIKMQNVKKDLIKNNQQINWVPAHLKKGRFGEWLKELKDWAFSRERYWGTPLPVWQCQKCLHQEVIGGKEGLLSQKFTENNYYVLRHGESVRNIEKITSCWPEKVRCPLTKKGREQIQRVAKEIKKRKIDLIFASDLLRTRQTAEIVTEETGAKIKFDKRIRELNVGIYNAKPLRLAQQAWGEPWERFGKRLPGGENYTDVKKRMHNFWKDIDARYKGKNILIISHECPISLLECMLKGFSNEEIVQYRGGKEKIKVGEWKELEAKVFPYNEKMELDFHRPYIDKVKFKCPECSGLMTRVPEVIDSWFDSGAMPFAQAGWPFAQNFQFPADYISEGIDQTRGWFYTLLAISTLLGFGPPYKNVISLELILDEKGEKMSKSKGNVVDPWYVVEKYGTDALRWYFYTVNQPGDVKLFSEKELVEALKKFIMTYWNSYLFFETYAQKKAFSSPKHVLDKWIVSRLNELIQEVTQKLNKYDVTSAARVIENFVINDLSLWYIRRSRRRFQKPETKKELKEASGTLNYVLLTLSKLTAPFVPFISEQIYYKNRSRSVHLENWPKADKQLISKKLNQEMEKVREIVNKALAERAKAGIKVRQPLASLELKTKNVKLKTDQELLELIKEEINVKKITFGKTLKLDTKITLDLKEEGIVREVIRQIQEMRKKAGYKPRHKILVQYFGTSELNKILSKNKHFILKETKAKDFRLAKKLKKVFDIEKESKIDQQELWLAIKKL